MSEASSATPKKRYLHSCSLVLSVEADSMDAAEMAFEKLWHTFGFEVKWRGQPYLVEIVAARSLTTYEAGLTDE